MEGQIQYDIARTGGDSTLWSRCDLSFSLSCAPQTREQEELEELLLLEQQGNEQRRLEVLQEEQRQLQAKRKNKQALLDELVRYTDAACTYVHSLAKQKAVTL